MQKPFLWPALTVRQLSEKFRGRFLVSLKKYLVKQAALSPYRSALETAWKKDWVVFSEPSLGKPQHVVGYLGQYTHRVAISNHRILEINKPHHKSPF